MVHAMKPLFITLTLLALLSSPITFASTDNCLICAEADSLAVNWNRATTFEEVDHFSIQSHELLKKLSALNKRGLNPQVVHAMVKVLATIYVHDDDPLDDELDQLRPAFKSQPFKALFDEEVSKLPAEQKEKLMVGINWMNNSQPGDNSDF